MGNKYPLSLSLSLFLLPLLRIPTNYKWRHHQDISLTSSVQKTANLANDLRDRVLRILKTVNEQKNHIPPVANRDITPFPYEVSACERRKR